MRSKPSEFLEECRIKSGPLGSNASFGNNGYFVVPTPEGVGNPMIVIASDQALWEHVSVSIRATKRLPSWGQMAYVKGLFWSEDETVFQFHPPRRLYVNLHPSVLHLWKPQGVEVPLPPTWMVGPVGAEANNLREATQAMREAVANPREAFPDIDQHPLPKLEGR